MNAEEGGCVGRVAPSAESEGWCAILGRLPRRRCGRVESSAGAWSRSFLLRRPAGVGKSSLAKSIARDEWSAGVGADGIALAKLALSLQIVPPAGGLMHHVDGHASSARPPAEERSPHAVCCAARGVAVALRCGGRSRPELLLSPIVLNSPRGIT